MFNHRILSYPHMKVPEADVIIWEEILNVGVRDNIDGCREPEPEGEDFSGVRKE